MSNQGKKPKENAVGGNDKSRSDDLNHPDPRYEMGGLDLERACISERQEEQQVMARLTAYGAELQKRRAGQCSIPVTDFDAAAFAERVLADLAQEDQEEEEVIARLRAYGQELRARRKGDIPIPVPDFDAVAFAEHVLADLAQEDQEEEEVMARLRAYGQELQTRREGNYPIPVPDFDAAAFAERTLADLAQEEQDEEEFVASFRPRFNSVHEAKSGGDDTAQRLEQRLQNIQRLHAELAAKRGTASERSADFTTGCEDLLHLMLATWHETPDKLRPKLLPVSADVCEVTGDFAWYVPVQEALKELQDALEELESFMATEQQTEEVVELRQHQRSTFLLAG